MDAVKKVQEVKNLGKDKSQDEFKNKINANIEHLKTLIQAQEETIKNLSEQREQIAKDMPVESDFHHSKLEIQEEQLLVESEKKLLGEITS